MPLLNLFLPTAMSRFLLLCNLLVMLAPSFAIAQSAPGSSRGDTRVASSTFAGIRPGDRIRWSQPDSGRLEGVFQGQTEGILLIRTLEVTRRLSAGMVDTLWTRGHSAGRGAAVGALGGGAAAALFLLGYSNAYGGDGSDSFGAATIGFAAGAVVGMVVGGAVGAVIPGWRRRFP